MKQALLLLSAILFIGAGCSGAITTDTESNNESMTNTAQPAAPADNNTNNPSPNNEMNNDTSLAANTELLTADVSLKADTSVENEPVSYTGRIKEYADGGYGSFSYYLATSSGNVTAVTVCDQRLSGINELLATVSLSSLTVDVSGTKTTGGICITGINTNNERSTTHRGTIVELANGGYGDYLYGIKTSNNTDVGLKVCDTRLAGFQTQIQQAASQSMTMTVHGSATKGGLCVTGMSL